MNESPAPLINDFPPHRLRDSLWTLSMCLSDFTQLPKNLLSEISCVRIYPITSFCGEYLKEAANDCVGGRSYACGMTLT